MTESGILIGLIILIILLFLAFEVISFIFWINMLTDALKKKDSLWIVLLIVGILTGALSGLFAALYYEIMYKDEQGHHKSNRAFTFMVISAILICLLSLVFLIIMLVDGTNIMNSIINSFAGIY